LRGEGEITSRSSVGAAYHVHQFRDFPVLVGLVPRRDRVLDAMGDMVAQDFLLDLAQRRPCRRDLRDDVDAGATAGANETGLVAHEIVIRQSMIRNGDVSERIRSRMSAAKSGIAIAPDSVRSFRLRNCCARRDHDSFHLNYWASVEKKPGSLEPGLRYWPCEADTITFQEG
jgi:hypothetical protein